MKKGRDGGEKNWKRLMIIVATTSLPAADRPNADRWNAACSCQNGSEFRRTEEATFGMSLAWL